MNPRGTFYDTIAADWDGFMNKYEIEKRLHLIFMRLLPDDLRDKKVLDAGCGTGWFTEKLVSRGARVISSDIGYQLLLATQKKAQPFATAQASVDALCFPANSFDVVLCTEVIEHTPDPQESVIELMRVVRPGGILILTVPNRIWHLSVSVADRLKIRPYHGFENWVWRHDLFEWVRESNGHIEHSLGFNLFPLFYKPFYRLLDVGDQLQVFAPLMVNIGIRVRKQAL